MCYSITPRTDATFYSTRRSRGPAMCSERGGRSCRRRGGRVYTPALLVCQLARQPKDHFWPMPKLTPFTITEKDSIIIKSACRKGPLEYSKACEVSILVDSSTVTLVARAAGRRTRQLQQLNLKRTSYRSEIVEYKSYALPILLLYNFRIEKSVVSNTHLDVSLIATVNNEHEIINRFARPSRARNVSSAVYAERCVRASHIAHPLSWPLRNFAIRYFERILTFVEVGIRTPE
ncbi:hypothetical protein EVAR_556_1 [Eumeta japonica]|uniref:Uncharacterized protein n=1 Tax=Eumeta variegata TaxID=151549 RepID=A0A4C1SDW6_EUMVA|nr:hypothetical protein EVAR_556_1 [Eumeta japonica]